MKLTDEIRAQVYRELADEIQQKGWDTMAILLREHADEKDPPRPEPLEVVVKVPPVSEWPDYMTGIEWKPIVSYVRSTWKGTATTIITRAEAEAMEAGTIPDPGEAALSNVLQDRIDRAVEYIRIVRIDYPDELAKYRGDLTWIERILTGEAEHGE